MLKTICALGVAASVGVLGARAAAPSPRSLSTGLKLVRSLAFSRDGQRLYALGTKIRPGDIPNRSHGASEVQAWSARNWSLARSIPLPRSYGNSLALSACGSLVAASGSEHFASDAWVWDTAGGRQKRFFPGAEAVAFSPDGRLVTVVQGGFDDSWRTRAPEVRLLDARNGRTRRALDLRPPHGLSFYQRDISASGSGSGTNWKLSPSGRFLAVALTAYSRPRHLLVDFGGVLLVDVRSRSHPRLLPAPAHDLSLGEWEFSPDERLLLVGVEPSGSARPARSRRLRFYETRSGRLARSLSLPGDEVAEMFSPNGASLLCLKWSDESQNNGTPHLRDARSGQLRVAFEGKVQQDALRFSPDGSLLAGLGYDYYDRRVLLWDARNGHLKVRLPGPRAPLAAAAFSPDSATLAVGGAEGAVKVWRVR